MGIYPAGGLALSIPLSLLDQLS
ncbi:protein of unknown function [Shinella sp. WSC3-e]|nr:protein of unknown function [Shinella sp. WSC3-e]